MSATAMFSLGAEEDAEIIERLKLRATEAMQSAQAVHGRLAALEAAVLAGHDDLAREIAQRPDPRIPYSDYLGTKREVER